MSAPYRESGAPEHLALLDYLRRAERRAYQSLAGLDVEESMEALRADSAEVCGEARVRAEIELVDTGATEVARERARRRLRARGSGLLSARTTEVNERVRRWRAEATVTFAGDQLPYLSVPPRLAEIADAAARRRLSTAYWQRTEAVTDDLAEVWARRRAAALELGYRSYAAAYAHWKNLDLDEVATLARATLAATEQRYCTDLARYLDQHVGVDVSDYHACDLPRLFRGGRWDEAFPAGQLLPRTLGAARDLGLDVAALPGVRLDLDARPGKSPRPFCAAVRVPEEIYLVALPTGGQRDYEEVLHELGHVAHFAFADRTAPWELRYLPDDSVAEAVAYLFAGLLYTPEFLVRRFGLTEPAAIEFARYARFLECAMVRRYCAKTLFEIEAHGAGDLASSAGRYAWWLREATRIEVAPQSVLTDTDAGLYSVQYLIAWFLAAHVRQRLVAEFGPAWFASPAARTVVRHIWARANQQTPKTMLAEAAGGSAMDWRPLSAALTDERPDRPGPADRGL
jgi:hypothetical protein